MRCRAVPCALLLLAGCSEQPPPQQVAEIVALARQVISDDCEKAAAQAFGLPQGELHVGAIEAEGRNFHAIGQWPEEGPAQLRFDCRYGPDGRFEGVNRL